jgi:hypothetical protein
MIKKYVAMGLGALIAVAPVAAMATTSTAKTHTAMHKTHKTHKTHETHTAKKKPAPAEAPKSWLMTLAPFGGREQDAKGARVIAAPFHMSSWVQLLDGRALFAAASLIDQLFIQ